MNVVVNHEVLKLADSKNLMELLSMIHLQEQKGIAVAINESLIPRANWPTTLLHENDTVTVIHATPGG